MRKRQPSLRIVAVGQTPPPVGGQAAAIESFVTGRYPGIEVSHVRMAFSRDTSDVGRARLGKAVHLAGLIPRVLWRRVRDGADVLYYPPAGPDVVPVIRDVVFLLTTRWAFRVLVLHFHASGVSELEQQLAAPLRRLVRAAYGGADLAIQTSALNPPDGRRLGAQRTVVVPCGVPDHALARRPRQATHSKALVLLYAGVLRESKGVLILLDACRRLHERGVGFHLRLMGGFESPAFESALRRTLAESGLADATDLLGVLSGDAKALCFHTSDIFCYPTYFEAESFGIAVVEAMQFSLPVVATRWRGIPSVLADGDSGLLVPPRDPAAFATALTTLIEDPELRSRMGERGRRTYLERFTETRFRDEMGIALLGLSPRSWSGTRG